MSVVIDNLEFDLLPSPSYAGYAPTRKAPKIKFEAESGYTHQRERWPFARRSWPLEWPVLTTAEKNTLENFLDYIKSTSFVFVPPDSLWPRPDGTILPEIHLCRVTDEDIVIKPISYGFWSAKITVEDL